MKKAGIREQLRRRTIEIYKETKNKVKVGNKRTEEIRSEMRQGCPMSSIFNVYIIDLEAEIKKKQTGGIVVEKERLWSITYSNIILLAKSEQELKGMMRKLKKYIERKGLILSIQKSKMLVFEKGRGSAGKKEWKWDEENIEEAKEIR